MRQDLGDFQTPSPLAAALVRRLGPIGARWPRVLEPTCGRGSFLQAVLDSPAPPREAIGVELQASYCDDARATLGDRATILQADVFRHDFRAGLHWTGGGPLLVIGNPPWVTSAGLGRMGSDNLPTKRNLKHLDGLAARTGSANFDLGEAVWLKLIDELGDQDPTIALLCKTAVARAVLDHAHRSETRVVSSQIVEIDAGRWFGASVGACFLTIEFGGGRRLGRTMVFPGPEASEPVRAMGMIRGRFASDLDAARGSEFAIGESPVRWRQGVKHDAAPIMELVEAPSTDGLLLNKLGEVADVEAARLYPLIKGADLKADRLRHVRRSLIITQEALGDDTRDLARTSPRLWAYLERHAGRLGGRRSSIYRGRPPYSIFGVGPYTFAPYKAVVAGVHRPTRFRAVGPVDGRPTVLDDTCYLAPCDSAPEAAVLAALGNDPICLNLIRALSSADAKRPVTSGILRDVDLGAVLARADRRELVRRATETLHDDLEWDAGAGAAAEVVESEIERLAPLLSPARPQKLDRNARTPGRLPNDLEDP